MTATEKARHIIVSVAGSKVTAEIMYLLDQASIRFFSMKKRSNDLSTRFHAHCWFLAKEIGKTKAEVYSEAIEYAMGFGEWPTRLIHPEVEIGGEMIVVDVEYPLSTTLATNAQLLKAYEYIVDLAAEHEITLPEGV